MMEEDGVKGQNQVQSMSKAMGSNYKQKQRAVLVTFGFLSAILILC